MSNNKTKIMNIKKIIKGAIALKYAFLKGYFLAYKCSYMCCLLVMSVKKTNNS